MTCKPPAFRYTERVPETTGDWIGVQNTKADNRHQAVFFRPSYLRTHLPRAGLGRGALGLTGSFVPVRQPCLVSAHPIGVGSGIKTAYEGGCIMRQALAHPEQTRHSLTINAGRAAAEQWLAHPDLSAGQYRDNRFSAHACGLSFTDLAERRAAFNQAYSRRIAEAIVGAEVSNV